MVLQPPSIVLTQGGQIISNSFSVAQWCDGLLFSLNPPVCQVYATVQQSIPSSASPTAILFDSENIDLYGMHSTTTNTSRITPTAPGWYDVSGGAVYAQNASGDRKIQPYVNSAPINYAACEVAGNTAAGVGTAIGVPDVLLFFNGTTDYVEMGTSQTSGGGLIINPNTSNESFMRVAWRHA